MLQECDECGTYNSEYYFDGSCMLCVTKRLENETRLKAENEQLREGAELLIDNSRPLNYEIIVYEQYKKGREIFKQVLEGK